MATVNNLRASLFACRSSEVDEAPQPQQRKVLSPLKDNTNKKGNTGNKGGPSARSSKAERLWKSGSPSPRFNTSAAKKKGKKQQEKVEPEDKHEIIGKRVGWLELVCMHGHTTRVTHIVLACKSVS